VEHFRVVPVIHFSPDFPLLERSNAIDARGGKFEMEFDRTDIEHGVQIEAPGYLTFRRARRYPAGAAVEPLDVRLQPARPSAGKVLDASGRPVKGARVYLATNFQHLDLDNLAERNAGDSLNFAVDTDPAGAFEIPPQIDRYALVVIAAGGYAQIDRQADE